MNRAFIARIARKIYIDRKSQKEVAEEERASNAKISRALKYAVEQGIIQFIIDEDGVPGIDRTLGRKLCRAYGLSHAIVVDVNALRLLPYQPAENDRLHYLLGKALAEHLAVLVRPGDHILTVGGRGPYFVAQHLAHTLDPNLYLRDVYVTAISGRMATEVHEPSAPSVASSVSSVDADDAAFFLAKALCRDFAGFHPMNRPVAYSDGYSYSGKDFEHLFNANGSLRNPSTICICGVGRLGGKHMYMRHEDPRLQAIAQDISGILGLLKGWEDKIEGWSFFPIGDVANRLFLTEEIEDRGLMDDLVQKISQINRKIVGLTFTQLALAPMIIVNAGGTHKFSAIHRVLSFRKPSAEPFVNILCTDSQVAERLISAGPQPPIDMRKLPGEEESNLTS